MRKKSDYLPIESYGVIGDLETVALVGLNGSIDFMCFPRFDSPTVFARLLDAQRGGYFQIAPANFDNDGNTVCKQMYLPETNVLVTRFLSEDGILELIDFMPIGGNSGVQRLTRIVTAVQGDIDVKVVCDCAFDYARKPTMTKRTDSDKSVYFECVGDDCGHGRLLSEVPLQHQGSVAESVFQLQEGKTVAFKFLSVKEDANKCEFDTSLASEDVNESLRVTSEFWRNWVSKSKYDGLWRHEVHRAALVLKLLFSKTYGSIVASPTFSLPEAIGGQRNWDYRFCWIRDSAFTVHAMLKLGFTEEAGHYMEWISQRYEQCDNSGELQLLYRIDGSPDIEERELTHLSGYADSAPVRIGNAAKNQLQLDIYGELIDAVYLTHKFSTPMSWQGWKNLCKTVEYVCENWSQPDESIWEIRGERKHFLHSRLMCWVALDRAIRLGFKGSFPAPIERWRTIRDKIHEDIHSNFWNEERQSFVQYQHGDTVDAALLLMPLVKFISPVDPRWTSTLETIKEDLVTDAFVHRYIGDSEFDGLDESKEGSFTMCSFWYCENLARAGRVDEATLAFQKMIGYANHLGLFSEELGFAGQHLGNFPQAFTHLALISAATAIDRARKTGGQPF